MTIIASANLGFPLPGATVDDERLADIAAVRSALVSLDTSVSELTNNTALNAHVGATGVAHGVATTVSAGFMSADDKLKLDGIAEGASGGGSTTVEEINVNTNAVSNTTYIMTASLILTLPLNPVVSDTIHFSNRSNTKTIVIARNGQKIMGLAEDMSIDISSALGSLVFVNNVQGWVLV